MCGILGIFNLNKKPIEADLLQRMTDIMSHRGPDGRGFLVADIKSGKIALFDKSAPTSDPDFAPTVGLGHRRLKVIDIATGQQPMSNEDGTIWVSFNGEIYNFQELRAELQSKGHHFKTGHSDTETIIHAYEEWGEECLQRFSGMFAFGLLDLKRRRIFLARDRAGEKPLYYYHHQGKFIFASEIKAILEDETVERDIDIASLSDYLRFGYIPAPKTIFKRISKLRPRHYILTNFESISSPLSQKAYWDIEWNPDESVSESEWCDRLKEELIRSVKLRMISDVPLGAFLSGGIDSSSIVALMSSLQKEPVKTFSIGFEDDLYNELPYARQIAKKYGTEHYEEIVKPDAIGILPKLAWQYDEPFGDSSAIPTYHVSKMAREKVVVALSGDAGDELFAGYNLYEYILKYQKFDLIPYFIRRLAFGCLAEIIPDNVKGERASTLLSLTKQRRYEHMLGSIIDWKKLLRKELRSDLEKLRGNSSQPSFAQYWAKVKDNDYITQMQYLDLNVYLPEDILVKVDRASMLNSLEVRIPFLEHKVIELAARIPSRFKMKGDDKKYIVKRMMADELGRDFLYRPKAGFAVPLGRWFRGSLKSYAEELLLDPKNFVSNYIELGSVREVLRYHRVGKRDFSSVIWNLLFLEHWGRAYK